MNSSLPKTEVLMKNLSKVIIACFVSLMVLSSCSKEDDLFVIDAATPVSVDKLSNDAEIVASQKTPLVDDYTYEGMVVSTKDNRPVHNVIVTVHTINKNGKTVAKTDVAGAFNLKLNVWYDKVVIKVERPGYVTQIVNLGDLVENTVYLAEQRRTVSGNTLSSID